MPKLFSAVLWHFAKLPIHKKSISVSYRLCTIRGRRTWTCGGLTQVEAGSGWGRSRMCSGWRRWTRSRRTTTCQIFRGTRACSIWMVSRRIKIRWVVVRLVHHLAAHFSTWYTLTHFEILEKLTEGRPSMSQWMARWLPGRINYARLGSSPQPSEGLSWETLVGAPAFAHSNHRLGNDKNALKNSSRLLNLIKVKWPFNS